MYQMSFISSSPWPAASLYSDSCRREKHDKYSGSDWPWLRSRMLHLLEVQLSGELRNQNTTQTPVKLFFKRGCSWCFLSLLQALWRSQSTLSTLRQEGVKKPHLQAGESWASGSLPRALQLLAASGSAVKLRHVCFQGKFVLKPVMFRKYTY